MARIRTIKPDFFTSDTVTALPLRARLTWVGLWTHCDDYGRCRDNVKLVKAAVWPLDDVSLRDIADDLTALERARVLFRYVGADGKAYIQVTNWSEHQKVDRPSKSTIPAPRDGDIVPPASTDTSSMDPREDVASAREPASRARDRKGMERKGKEQPTTGDPVGPGRNAYAREAEPPPSDEPASRVEELITWYRDNSPRGVPSKLAAGLAAEIHQLIADNFTDDEIRQGLALLRTRKGGVKVLHNLVDEVANRQDELPLPATAGRPGNAVALRGNGGPPPRKSTTDERVSAALALAAKYDQAEGGQP